MKFFNFDEFWAYQKAKKMQIFNINIKLVKINKFIFSTNNFGTIYVSSLVKSKLSTNALKVAILHERFHQRLRQKLYGKIISICSLLLFIFSILAIPRVIFALVVQPIYIIDDIFTLLILLTIFFLYLHYRRLEEVAADLYSVRHVGSTNFKKGIIEIVKKFPEEFPKKLKPGHIFRLLTHGNYLERIKLINEKPLN